VKMSIRHVNRMNILNARICKKNKIHTKPEKGGRKPAPSRNLFGSAKKCRGSLGYDPSLPSERCLHVPFFHTCPCFATLHHSFLGITPHPLANCLAPNPNGRCSPLSFGSLVFSICLPLCS
jgi:hypothetical protein